MKKAKKPLALFIVILMVLGSANLSSFAEAVENEQTYEESTDFQEPVDLPPVVTVQDEATQPLGSLPEVIPEELADLDKGDIEPPVEPVEPPKPMPNETIQESEEEQEDLPKVEAYSVNPETEDVKDLTTEELDTRCPIDTIDIPVLKVWVGPEKGPVTITLYADGLPTCETLELTVAKFWKDSFFGLRKFDAQTHKPICYSVVEEEVIGYSSEVTGSALCGFIVTNILEDTLDIPVSKVWIGPEKGPVTITLYADAVATAQTLDLSGANCWKGSFSGLSKRDAVTGKEILYTVVETPVPGYSTLVTGDMATGFIVTNTNDEMLDIPVNKIWIGPSKDSVTITLYADAVATTKTLELSEANSWKDSFKGLRKYDAVSGKEILYTVVETEIPEYCSLVTGSVTCGFTVTNTIKCPPTVCVKAIKVWITGPGEDPFKRPEVNLQLYQNDKAYGPVIVLKSKTYSYQWKDLPEFDEKDKAYTYRVEEINVPKDYKMSVYNMGNIYTITNKWTGAYVPHKPYKPNPYTPRPTTSRGSYTPSLPKTGSDASGLYLGFIALAAGIKLLLSDDKKKNLRRD